MAQPSKLEKAILRTLCYADVFDYPLTGKEVFRWLIGPLDPPALKKKTGIINTLKTANHKIKERGGYYYFSGRSQIISLRQRRLKYAQEKLAVAVKVAKWLNLIPSVRIVAVSGALAMNNADRDDDIDLLIVTTKDRLWLTRLIVVPLVSLVARRRKPGKQWDNADTIKQWKNAICLNLFLDEDALIIPSSKRNLYTAHEIVQIKPLLNKAQTYEKFLSRNIWINDYLPNIKINQKPETKNQKPENRSPINLCSLLSLLNFLAFKLQLFYMEPRMTRESVNAHSAFFHPRNTADLVLEEYQKRLLPDCKRR